MTVLTKQNADKVSTVRNIPSPEWGTKRFNYRNDYWKGEYFHSVGSGRDSALLHECEFRFWEVINWKLEK
jgi:hypothetical protein